MWFTCLAGKWGKVPEIRTKTPYNPSHLLASFHCLVYNSTFVQSRNHLSTDNSNHERSHCSCFTGPSGMYNLYLLFSQRQIVLVSMNCTLRSVHSVVQIWKPTWSLIKGTGNEMARPSVEFYGTCNVKRKWQQVQCVPHIQLSSNLWCSMGKPG